MRTVEEKLSTNQYLLQREIQFLADMRKAAAAGVGYGWMQQVIEWEWQTKSEHSWGPEYFERRIAELEKRLPPSGDPQ